MVTHLSIIHGLGCLTSVIWPFNLTALIVVSWLYCGLLRHLTWESYCPFVEKKNKVYCSLILEMANICTILAWPKKEGSEHERPDFEKPPLCLSTLMIHHSPTVDYVLLTDGHFLLSCQSCHQHVIREYWNLRIIERDVLRSERYFQHNCCRLANCAAGSYIL